MRNKFPDVIDAKIKEGMFIGPQIRELMQDKQFVENLNGTEKMQGCLVRGFARTAKYQDVVQDLLTSYKTMGCNMSLKKPLFGIPLGIFPRKARRSQ